MGQKQKLVTAQSQTTDKRSFYREVHEVLGVSKEHYNSCPSLQKAHAYAEEKQIPRLLETLMARVALERPQDLRGFLKKTLTEMKESRAKPSMGMFTDQNLETMFSMWDEQKQGVIPTSKVVETLNALQCGRNAEEAVRAGVSGDATEVD